MRKTAYIQHVLAKATIDSCVVSAADKLHNARAILHDLRATTDRAAFWGRFNPQAPQERQGWYYGGLEGALRGRLERLDARQMVRELEHALDAIAALPECGPFAAGLALADPGELVPTRLIVRHEDPRLEPQSPVPTKAIPPPAVEAIEHLAPDSDHAILLCVVSLTALRNDAFGK